MTFMDRNSSKWSELKSLARRRSRTSQLHGADYEVGGFSEDQVPACQEPMQCSSTS